MYGALNQSLTYEGNTHVITVGDVLRCIVIIIIMLLIIVGNVGCLVVFNSPKTKKQFIKRVRYMMNSLCCTDLSMGLLMCPSTIYPALKHCWPFGVFMCKFEALLISALFHESTLNMVLIAIDRCCIIHCSRYNNIMTSKRFLFVIIGTWVTVFTCYAVVIFGTDEFYYDNIGINCKLFCREPKVTLTVLSIFYFVPAVIFVVCYGSIYRTATQRKVLTVSPDDKHGKMVNANIRTSKYLAAITGGFFVAVSPFTLCTLIIVAAKVTLQDAADFFVTWLALSNSFWNCLIYGLMNRKFRRAALKLACGKWIKSIKESVYVKSHDESRDFSEDSTAHANYKRRISNKKKAMSRSADEMSITVTGSMSARNTPNHSPAAIPKITHTRVQHKQVTELIQETKGL
ncbi:trace amine-associated receptor 1-like [Ruditapes philippinarum]|uniref:trace amine-associated receptor 1-like n=1 Tax=Ruditapes philippinarum TaxID=129788 RepID=UPI00295BD994|nr:trace amine-associated receptor 1-like [Ruditapes philippinarum]